MVKKFTLKHFLRETNAQKKKKKKKKKKKSREYFSREKSFM